MNPNYTEFKFPQIKAHPWHKVRLLVVCFVFFLDCSCSCAVGGDLYPTPVPVVCVIFFVEEHGVLFICFLFPVSFILSTWMSGVVFSVPSLTFNRFDVAIVGFPQTHAT